MTKEKDNKVRIISIADNVRVKLKSRLYEAIIKNTKTGEEENRSDPMEYDDAVSWGKSNKDEETYSIIKPFAGFKEPTQ